MTIQRVEPALELQLEAVHRSSQQRAAELQLGGPIRFHRVREPGGNPRHLPGDSTVLARHLHTLLGGLHELTCDV